MNVNEIKARAEALGVKTAKLRKVELILSIQRAEGNTPCYGRNDGGCEYRDCCWYDDCASEYDGQHRPVAAPVPAGRRPATRIAVTRGRPPKTASVKKPAPKAVPGKTTGGKKKA